MEPNTLVFGFTRKNIAWLTLSFTVSTHADVHSEALEVVPAVVTGLTILNSKSIENAFASCDKRYFGPIYGLNCQNQRDVLSTLTNSNKGSIKHKLRQLIDMRSLSCNVPNCFYTISVNGPLVVYLVW